MRFLKALWLTVFFFLSLTFFVQNAKVLDQKLSLQFDFYYFNYVWTNTAVPFYFVILVAFAVGALVTLGYLFMDRVRARMELGRYRKIIRRQDKELRQLRSIPLQATPLLEASGKADKPADQNAA